MTDLRPNDSPLVGYTHIVYALHALSVVIALTTAASIIGSFIFGIPSIIAVIMNYVKRGEVAGTWLESHFRWQIRTFWGALWATVLVAVISAPLMLLLVGFITLPIGIAIISVWIMYRVIRGWLALREGRSMPMNGAPAARA